MSWTNTFNIRVIRMWWTSWQMVKTFWWLLVQLKKVSSFFNRGVLFMLSQQKSDKSCCWRIGEKPVCVHGAKVSGLAQNSASNCHLSLLIGSVRTENGVLLEFLKILMTAVKKLSENQWCSYKNTATSNGAMKSKEYCWITWRLCTVVWLDVRNNISFVTKKYTINTIFQPFLFFFSIFIYCKKKIIWIFWLLFPFQFIFVISV